MATLQREHARSQQKMGALLESRVKNVGDLRQQLEHQIDSLKSQLEASQVTGTTLNSAYEKCSGKRCGLEAILCLYVYLF